MLSFFIFDVAIFQVLEINLSTCHYKRRHSSLPYA